MSTPPIDMITARNIQDTAVLALTRLLRILGTTSPSTYLGEAYNEWHHYSSHPDATLNRDSNHLLKVAIMSRFESCPEPLAQLVVNELLRVNNFPPF